MKHRLSFCTVTIINDNIIDVVIDPNVKVSLEMAEEFDGFLNQQFNAPFGILVNKIHPYDFSFEAIFSVASHQHIKAIAAVYYSEKSAMATKKHQKIRQKDWNLALFSGFELGYQQAHEWLNTQLNQLNYVK
jgi:hypothetical protein